MQSFFDIEEKKKKITVGFFLFLLFLYFFTFYFIFLIIKGQFINPFSSLSLFISFLVSALTGQTPVFIKIIQTSLKPIFEILIVFFISFIVAYFHWKISTENIVEKILLLMGAKSLDEEDTFHQKLKNIVEEISVSAGGIKIETSVISVYPMNAFSLSDFKGRNIVGVTEGLLSSLNRTQLQAVVAHEVAHIINGDSLLKTIATSLFDIYNFMLENLSNVIRKGSRIPPFVLLIYVFLFIIRSLSRMVNFFISREREYLADATAVQLTRFPQALAEAFYIISRHSHSVGTGMENFENIFIVNPKNRAIAEKEGIIADLFSTHPPVKRRIDTLLNMAHDDFLNMVEEIKKEETEKQEVTPTTTLYLDKKYFICNPQGEWKGPFNKNELTSLFYLKPDTFIYNSELKKGIYKISEDEELSSIFNKNDKLCPACKVNLPEVYYEGAKILSCNYCNGYFLEEDKIIRVLSRRGVEFSEEVKRQGKIIEENMNKFVYKTKNIDTPFKLLCPKCNQKMRRMFYNYLYPLEIDKCLSCFGVWFEKNELEILQYLFEKGHNSISFSNLDKTI